MLCWGGYGGSNQPNHSYPLFPLSTQSAPCPCNDIDPDDYFKSITTKAGSGEGGTLRGKTVKYTLNLNPLKDQPTPALRRSLDLRIELSPFQEVKKAQMKRPAGSSAITATINREDDTVTWANIGDALLGVGSKKGVPQKLTFNIASIVDEDTPKGDLKIKAYLVDDAGNVCKVLVAETKVLIRDPTGLKDVK